MRVGYVRVSSGSQNPERQIVALKQAGVEKIFEDIRSGKDTNRNSLKDMMSFVREGDTVVVESISRLGRNTKDLLSIVDEFNKKSVGLLSLKEAFDSSTPSGKLVLTIFAAISQMEREYIRDRQREGIDLLKAKGGYKGRKPIQIDDDKFKAIYDFWKSDQITAVEAMRRLGLKKSTFYRRIKEFKN